MSAHYTLAEVATSPDLRCVIYAALADVVRKHDILSATPVDEASPYAYFARLPAIDLGSCVFFKTRSKSVERGEGDSELDALLQEQHNIDFKSHHGTLPFWRLIVLRDAEAECSFTASFIFHHSLGDGATGTIFHTFFWQSLNTNVSLPSFLEQSNSLVKVPGSTELLPPLEELHPLPLNPNPLAHQTQSMKEWTGNPIQLPLESLYRSIYFSPTSSTKFAQRCKENGVTVTSGLVAVMAGAMFDALPPTIDALTGIVPINLRPWLNLPPQIASGAMGSFIDATKMQICRSHYEVDVQATIHGLPAARHTADEIKRYLTLNLSPSGEPYTSVAAFKGIPDIAAVFKSMVGTNRDAAFEISNLGRFPDDGQTKAEAQWCIGRMAFSRSAVAFGAALTTSVISGADGGLTIGFSWQECVVDNAFVNNVIGRFREGFDSDGF